MTNWGISTFSLWGAGIVNRAESVPVSKRIGCGSRNEEPIRNAQTEFEICTVFRAVDADVVLSVGRQAIVILLPRDDSHFRAVGSDQTELNRMTRVYREYRFLPLECGETIDVLTVPADTLD